MPLIETFGSGSSRGLGRGLGGGALYAFASHTFTTAGTTGRLGPSLASLQSTYSSQAWAQNTLYFDTSAGRQIWTVPATGTYSIEAAGADHVPFGGGSFNQSFGRGWIKKISLLLTAGDKLRIIVGQLGSISSGVQDGAGGGASAVMYHSNQSPIIVSGGGGASTNRNSNNESNSNATGSESLTPFTFLDGGYASSSVATGGNGGFGSGNASNAIYTGGAGGFYSNGQDGNQSYGNVSNTSGSNGKALNSSAEGGLMSNGNQGGFGGGSVGQGGYTGPGGGGGWNGGNAGGYSSSSWGMGGSSYRIGGGLSTLISDSLKSGGQSAGYVQIVKL
jgi:hypothetical protein